MLAQLCTQTVLPSSGQNFDGRSQSFVLVHIRFMVGKYWGVQCSFCRSGTEFALFHCRFCEFHLVCNCLNKLHFATYLLLTLVKYRFRWIGGCAEHNVNGCCYSFAVFFFCFSVLFKDFNKLDQFSFPLLEYRYTVDILRLFIHSEWITLVATKKWYLVFQTKNQFV